MQLLVVEDNLKLADVLARSLREGGDQVEVTHDGETGLALVSAGAFDAAVVDIVLPGIDGFDLIRTARDRGVETPILVLTARDDVTDRVRGLDEGADDYVTKPFALPELKARLRALVRRGRGAPPKLQWGGIVLDPVSRRVTRDGEEVHLTAREFELLAYLLRNVGRVLTRTAIGEHVWDINFESTSNVIDVYVQYLRRKLDREGEASFIKTLRGVGYRLG